MLLFLSKSGSSGTLRRFNKTTLSVARPPVARLSSGDVVALLAVIDVSTGPKRAYDVYRFVGTVVMDPG